MKFSLQVGECEKHTIEFSFNQLFGRSVVAVDGQEVFRKKRWFSEPVQDLYEVNLEGNERIHLRIEKERGHLLASRYKVYVDNRLTHLYSGV